MFWPTAKTKTRLCRTCKRSHSASSTRPMLTQPGLPTRTFERTWAKRCPGVVTSLWEGGDELLTFFTFPKAPWKTLRTTNTIERLHEESRHRMKTQGSLPGEDTALILLFSLVASAKSSCAESMAGRKSPPC